MRALYRAGHQASTAELDPASLGQQLDLSATEALCFYLTSGWLAIQKKGFHNALGARIGLFLRVCQACYTIGIPLGVRHADIRSE
jgi:hypothetical protein